MEVSYLYLTAVSFPLPPLYHKPNAAPVSPLDIFPKILGIITFSFAVASQEKKEMLLLSNSNLI